MQKFKKGLRRHRIEREKEETIKYREGLWTLKLEKLVLSEFTNHWYRVPSKLPAVQHVTYRLAGGEVSGWEEGELSSADFNGIAAIQLPE